LLVSHPSSAAAPAARIADRAGLGPLPVAAVAKVLPLDRDFFLAAEDRLLEGDTDPLANVSAIAGSYAERTEDVSEETIESHGAQVDDVAAPAGLKGRSAEPIERRALLLVSQDLVRGVDLLESGMR
jgi:hypothetical protein